MQINTELINFKTTKEMRHYLHVLKTVYKINKPDFIRQAVIEKLQRDVPEIHRKHKEKDFVYLPF